MAANFPDDGQQFCKDLGEGSNFVLWVTRSQTTSSAVEYMTTMDPPVTGPNSDLTEIDLVDLLVLHVKSASTCLCPYITTVMAT